jgi:hypothetical protein
MMIGMMPGDHGGSSTCRRAMIRGSMLRRRARYSKLLARA